MREGERGRVREGVCGGTRNSEMNLCSCSYYKTNDVSRFTYDRPFHNGRKDPECEFAVSKTAYACTV